MKAETRLRAIERAVRPQGRSDDRDAREVERLLGANGQESGERRWWEAALRLAARFQGILPSELEHEMREGAEMARHSVFFIDHTLLRAMVRAGPRWVALSEDERDEACYQEEVRVLAPRATDVLRAAVEHSLADFKLADVVPFVPGAFGYLLVRLAAWGVLVPTNEAFGAELRRYRVADEWRRRVQDEPRPGMPPDPEPPAPERSRPPRHQREREPVPA